MEADADQHSNVCGSTSFGVVFYTQNFEINLLLIVKCLKFIPVV